MEKMPVNLCTAHFVLVTLLLNSKTTEPFKCHEEKKTILCAQDTKTCARLS